VNVPALGGKSATVPLPELHLQNIGTADKGVTAAELSKQILKPLLASVTKAATDAISGLGKGVQDIGKGATDELKKSGKGIQDIFKK
jgi:hypothetical protein